MVPYFHVFQTDFGYAAFEYHKAPVAINKIRLPCQSLKKLTEGMGIRLKDHNVPEPIAILAEAVRLYFQTGKPAPPSIELLDMRPLTAMQQLVLKTIATTIPAGETRSYGEVAVSVGKPKAARFVGNTMAINPFPIIIPCHRVIRSDGSVGNFGGGSDMKKRMLALEAAYAGRPHQH